MTPPYFCGTIPCMRVAVLVVFLAASSSSLVAAGQSVRPGAQVQATDSIAEAYTQFMMAHRLEEDNDIDGAIAAYKRAITLDPQSADIVAELADLYLRQNRAQDALQAGEQALKIAPANPDAHRVLGTVYASMATAAPRGQRSSPEAQKENLTKSIDHLEKAIVGPVARADASAEASPDSSVTTRMPRPPPPAAALSISGYPISRVSCCA